jgi:hypothetical protein
MDLPPKYDDGAAACAVKVHFKQTTHPATPAKNTNTALRTPLWTRLLAVAISREWLHSSGILSIYQAHVTTQTTFEGFDKSIRNRLDEGGHGPPMRWLGWTYVLRGRWLGKGKELETIVLDQESWENGKVAMQAMLDVRIDLVYFLKGRRRNERAGDLPPPYDRHLRKSLKSTEGDVQNENAGDGGEYEGSYTTVSQDKTVAVEGTSSACQPRHGVNLRSIWSVFVPL